MTTLDWWSQGLTEPVPMWLLFVFAAIAGVAVVLMDGYRHSAAQWKARAQVWFQRATDAGWTPTLTQAQAERVMADLFPRPMGAAPSTTADVDAMRFWREQRALQSRDHTTRHVVEASSIEEAANEFVTFTIGPDGRVE